MRFLFNLSAFLAILSVLSLVGLVGFETFSGYHNFSFEGTSMTVRFSVPDRVLLVLFLVFAILAAYFWSRISRH